MTELFAAVETKKKAVDLVPKLRNTIKHMGAAKLIPLIKIERKPGKEYFIFLAIEGGNLESPLPSQAAQVMLAAGLAPKQAIWPLTADQVEKMSGSVGIDTQRIDALNYRVLWTTEDLDPLDLSELKAAEEVEGDPSFGERIDRLLYWLSATGGGSYTSFVEACKALQLAEDRDSARSVYRKVILLGHIESSGDGTRWSACPAALVMGLPDGARGFLCGQRTPKAIESLSGDVSHTPQPGYQGPSRLTLSTELSEMPQWLTVAGEPSLILSQRLPDLDGWKRSLTRIDKPNVANYSAERHDGRAFVPCDLVERNGIYEGASGMYRLTRRNGPGSQAHSMVLYFDQDSQEWLRGDWYGLRFLSLHSGNQKPRAAALPDNRLGVPVNERWPLIYERALVAGIRAAAWPGRETSLADL